MNKNYIFRCATLQGRKTKVALITFTITVFTFAFSQAQETTHPNRSGKLLMAKEQTDQKINRHSNVFSVNGHKIKRKNTSAKVITPSFKLGNDNNNSAVAGQCEKGAISVNIDQLYGNLNTYAFADDFVVAPNEIFYLDEIEFIFLMDYDVTADEMLLTFHQDRNGNGPGTEIPFSEDGVQVNMESLGEYENTIKDIMLITVTFPTPLEFVGGAEGASYWAGTRITHNGSANSAAAIGTNTMSASQTFYVKSTNSWIKSTAAYENVPPQDLIVGFYGQCEEFLGAENNTLMTNVHLFPNPLNDNTFYINAPKLDGETVSITVNDMLGREIANIQQTFSGSNVKIDLSQDLKSGIYMVTISSNGTDKTLRVIKR
jgi:hypothetical protein